ncbi:serine hydrolase domain-containing protein [candidate division KSB1 bacterium]
MKYSRMTAAASLYICFLIWAVHSVIAQDIPAVSYEKRIQIDRIFAHFNHDTPGAALAVVKDGEILYAQGYGMANLEYDIPTTPQSVFHVASISKQFTAMSIVLLAQQGKLLLDDPIRKHLPEVPDFGETITIRHLIHHISGLRDQWELFSMSGWRGRDLKAQEDVLNFVVHQNDLNFTPGSEYLYCNTGYTLLAIIVERVSDMSFKEFTGRNIFEPLGMSRTHFHDDMGLIVKGRAYAYRPRQGGDFEISIPNFETVGATSLFTTVEDLALWADNFNHKHVGGSEAIDQMFVKGMLNNDEDIDYAFALTHGMYRGIRTIGHSGSDAGYRAQFTMYPDQNMAIIVLSNVSNGNPGRLARQVADVVLEEYFTEPVQESQQRSREREETPEPPVLTEAQRAEYAGRYYSEELDVYYVVTVVEGNLALQQKKFEGSILNYRGNDLFAAGRQYQFTRDRSGRIDVRNLRFIKR